MALFPVAFLADSAFIVNLAGFKPAHEVTDTEPQRDQIIEQQRRLIQNMKAGVSYIQ